MGRKLPIFAPAAVTAAGRKRKGSTLATLAACKRPAPAQIIGGWASLPTDILGLITCRILDGDGDGDGDVVDYIAFRAVCSGWRACTPTPRDPTLRDPRLRPVAWVALCDGDAIRPDDACEAVFFHTRTARRLRVLLPELRRHRIVGFTDGLLILVHKSTTQVRVLHPFTRVVVDFPPLAPVYHKLVRQKKLLDMDAAVCSSASSETSIAVVVWFLCTDLVLGADPGSADWEVLHTGRVWSTLPFQGKLYATLLCSRKMVQLYPPGQDSLENSLVLPHVNRMYCNFLLVESGGRMLLVIWHLAPHANSPDWLPRVAFKLYALDLNAQCCRLVPVNSLGDRTLFLSRHRCLSVSARDLPSLSRNSIYFSLPHDPIIMHSLGSGLSERLAESCQIHDGKDRIRPSVRPFTVADHLITYCNPHEWSKGLMFHEYQHIPKSFKELIKNIRAQNVQMKILHSLCI